VAVKTPSAPAFGAIDPPANDWTKRNSLAAVAAGGAQTGGEPGRGDSGRALLEGCAAREAAGGEEARDAIESGRVHTNSLLVQCPPNGREAALTTQRVQHGLGEGEAGRLEAAIRLGHRYRVANQGHIDRRFVGKHGDLIGALPGGWIDPTAGQGTALVY